MHYTAALLFLSYIFYASVVGIKLSYSFQWSNLNTVFLPLPTTVGLGLAPFLLGFPIIFSLYFFSSFSAPFHLFFLLLVLLFLHAMTLLSAKRNKFFFPFQGVGQEEGCFILLLLAWVFFLFFNSFYYALYQNDALEYMTVARQLFATNSLHSYPMINQELTQSGFYGPWTHPPLYVSLLYLTQIIQGHAIVPGLGRLIAPWVAFVATLIVYSLGGMHSRLTAVLSALIFISTPLFFLGATTALIDSLPVLGFTLTLAVLVGLAADYRRKWQILGLIAGASLWSHSQAILLPVMLAAVIFLLCGFKHWKKALKAIFTVLSISFLIALGPYLKNWLLFGSPISDNPLVFSLPSLKWDEYFTYGRGLENTVALIQYGVFKGWFAVEAFGVSFWIMSMGAFIFLRRTQLKSNLKNGLDTLFPSDLLFTVCLLFLFIYMSGTLASVLIGLNLMVKNERYLLVVLPFVAIIAGYGGTFFIEALSSLIKKGSEVKKYVYYFSWVLLITLLMLMLYVIAVVYPSKYLSKNTVYSNVHDRLLSALPSTGLMLKASQTLPKDALVLSLKPADMYYLHRKMVSYLDPRLVPFYREKAPEKAAKMLKDLGINYIQTTDYALPVQYNSVLNKLLNDPRLTQLVISNLANEIYELKAGQDQFKLVKDFTPGKFSWRYYRAWNLMGRKNLFEINQGAYKFSTLNEDKPLDFRQFLPINHRHYSHIIFSNPTLILKPKSEYCVSFDLEGEGFVRFYMIEFSEHNRPLNYFENILTSIRIGEIVLSKSKNKGNYSKRFIAQGKKVIFFIEIVGSSKLHIKEAQLYRLS